MNQTSENLTERSYKAYENDNIIVYWNASICEHAGNCVRGNSEVFDAKRKPWIILGNGEHRNIPEVIDTCPSGALKYHLKKA